MFDLHLERSAQQFTYSNATVSSILIYGCVWVEIKNEGAVFINAPSASVLCDTNIFKNCTSTNAGGGMRLIADTARITKMSGIGCCSYKNSWGEGGHLFSVRLQHKDMTVDYCSTFQCPRLSEGTSGSIFAENCKFTLKMYNATDNHPLERGGSAALLKRCATVQQSFTNVYNTSNGSHGAFYYDYILNGYAKTTNLILNKQYSSVLRGLVFLYGTTTEPAFFTLDGWVIQNNTAVCLFEQYEVAKLLVINCFINSFSPSSLPLHQYTNNSHGVHPSLDIGRIDIRPLFSYTFTQPSSNNNRALYTLLAHFFYVQG